MVPFLMIGASQILLLSFSPANNELLSSFVVSGSETLGLPPPGRTGVSTAGGPTFPTTHRVIYWIHRHATNFWAISAPTIGTSFSQGDVLMV